MSGPNDPLRAEHQRLKAEARATRRSFASGPQGAIARELRAAMTEYHRMREQGVSREDACKGLEAVIREVWPKGTTKFPPTCEVCEDPGWIERTCWAEQRCGRKVCVDRHPSFEHAYVEPCHCLQGERHRRKVRTVEDQLAAVGKTTKRKPGGWRQVGS